jgi:hypothetical protein
MYFQISLLQPHLVCKYCEIELTLLFFNSYVLKISDGKEVLEPTSIYSNLFFIINNQLPPLPPLKPNLIPLLSKVLTLTYW